MAVDMKMAKDLTGMKFNKLTGVRKVYVRKSKWIWLWLCDCGNEKEIVGTEVTQGKTKSCGCEKYRQGGDTSINGKRHQLYSIYYGMRTRCNDLNAPEYHNYGGRGIKICEEWLDNYKNFKVWAIHNGYDDNLTLERRDVNGNYSPDNCTWATIKEQNNNKRNTIFVEINGVVKSLSEWADETGINHTSLFYRYNKGDRDEYLIRPVKNIGQKKSNIDNISWSIRKKKWSVRFKINNTTKTSMVIGYYETLAEAVTVKEEYLKNKYSAGA